MIEFPFPPSLGREHAAVEDWMGKVLTALTERFKSGAVAPEGVVTANIGCQYICTAGGAGTTLYLKESGDGTNTGWAAK